jgi:hypothetical protein
LRGHKYRRQFWQTAVSVNTEITLKLNMRPSDKSGFPIAYCKRKGKFFQTFPLPLLLPVQ